MKTERSINILLKGVTKAIENETKEQKEGFLGMLLGTLGASLLGNMLTKKWMLRAGYGHTKGKAMLIAGSGNKIIINAVSSFNKFWNTETSLF